MGTPELTVGVRNEGSLLWRHFPRPLVSELQATSPTQTLLSFLPTVTPNHPNRKGQGDRGREVVPTLSGVLSRCNFMGASVYTSIKRDPQCLPLVVSQQGSKSTGPTLQPKPLANSRHTAPQGTEVSVGVRQAHLPKEVSLPRKMPFYTF